MTSVKPVKSGVKPHLFVPDPDLPARHDQDGRVVSPGCCARCNLPGQPGDAHHTLPSAPPEQDEHRRRIGEQP